jgi:hypothetical protein
MEEVFKMGNIEGYPGAMIRRVFGAKLYRPIETSSQAYVIELSANQISQESQSARTHVMSGSVPLVQIRPYRR